MTEPNFEGHDGRECSQHRTVGPHRAWCFDCAEWCYPGVDAACKGCELPLLRAALDEANTRIEDLKAETFPATWHGLLAFLNKQYPEDIFPGDFTDGPGMVRAARALAEAVATAVRWEDRASFLEKSHDHAVAQAQRQKQRADRVIQGINYVHVWTNEDGRQFLFADDVRAALAGEDNGDSDD